MYADWALGAARRRVIEAQGDSVDALARRMKARAESGEESMLAARRLALAAVEFRAEAAAVAAEAARHEAAALAWYPTTGPGGPESWEPEIPELPPVPASFDTSQAPALVALQHEAEAADYRARLGGRYFEFPTLTFGWQQLSDGTDDTDGPLFGVSWPVPIFDRNQGDASEARMKGEAARARAALARREMAAHRGGALAAYRLLRQRALDSRTADDDAERAVGSAVASYRLGESSLTDLLDILRSAAAARLAVLDLHAAALDAHRRLELAAGHELPVAGGSR